jgi:hypothetical protein
MSDPVMHVDVAITKSQVMMALRELTINDEHFLHEQWSIWDAEVMERAAKMIRDGYEAQDGAKAAALTDDPMVRKVIELFESRERALLTDDARGDSDG